MSDASIRALNRRYRKKNKATDVLSFPLLEEAELRKAKGEIALGDVVISVERAAAQAKERGHSLRRELDVLLVHGMLHLLGYDHEYSKAGAARMRRMENKILGHPGLIPSAAKAK